MPIIKLTIISVTHWLNRDRGVLIRLVIIYGPPAVGKLTVAKELSKITGYKVFHNHLTVDLVSAIYEFGSKEYKELLTKYRFELLEKAAMNKKIRGLIFTCVYLFKKDDDELKKIEHIIEKHNGKVCFVQLITSMAVLKRRIKDESRKKYNKMKRVRSLVELMNKYDLIEPIGFSKSLKIDNTKISPQRAARMIKEHYALD
jgi:broad-specificity NMP kinase